MMLMSWQLRVLHHNPELLFWHYNGWYFGSPYSSFIQYSVYINQLLQYHKLTCSCMVWLHGPISFFVFLCLQCWRATALEHTDFKKRKAKRGQMVKDQWSHPLLFVCQCFHNKVFVNISLTISSSVPALNTFWKHYWTLILRPLALFLKRMESSKSKTKWSLFYFCSALCFQEIRRKENTISRNLLRF